MRFSTSFPQLVMRKKRQKCKGGMMLILWCHSLREMDIELMRRLSPRVNVIPVVGKADSLTPSELRGFKKRVSAYLTHHFLLY
jgi:septin family protein